MKEEMNSVFSEQVLAEKLLKLNNSQQSIETLSHWCIFHRKKAKNIVETWEGQFNSSSREQKVCLMYLANDILQNSKRKGNEFVNEFWKVLPPALRNILENGDENAKKVVTRLIEIWDLRKVFGSRSKALKDDIFGDSPPTPILENNGKNSNSNSNLNLNPVKVVRKDANTVRIKVAVGGMPEKIMTAYQTMLEKCSNEESDLNNFNSSINLLDKIEKDINDALTSGNQQQVSSLLPEFNEKENSLKQSIEHLEGIETIRASLINQLKEALKEQESKSELNRARIQAGLSKMEQAVQLKHKISSPSPTNNSDASDFKKTAAEVAARLAASSSSAQLFSSVLSSFAFQSHSSPNNNPNTTFPNTTNNPNTTFPNTTNPNTTTGITNTHNNVESECKRQRIDNGGSFVPLVPVSVPLSVPMQFGGFGFNGGSMPPPPPLTSAPLTSAPGQQGFFQSQPGIGFFPLQPAPSAQRQQ